MTNALNERTGEVRVLLLADTHVGFDQPVRPRIQRRRRGEDFRANFESSLNPALQGEVDLVVHGGDLLFRSKVPPSLVSLAMEPLMKVADRGVPVFIVPGNHERGKIPHRLLACHQKIFVFDEPRTFVQESGGIRVALSGFPYTRDIRSSFRRKVDQTGFGDADAEIRLLCIHQIVEGARVGTPEYIFRAGPEVIRGRDIPEGFAAVLSGHIHRSQKLDLDLAGRNLASPVVYPGSVERTSLAERNETKHYARIEFQPRKGSGGRVSRIMFEPLPTRPMIRLQIDADRLDSDELRRIIRSRLSSLHPDSVVYLKLDNTTDGADSLALSAEELRQLSPPTMNVQWMGRSFRRKAEKRT